MGIFNMIKERKEKIASSFEARADRKLLERSEKLDTLRAENEKLQVRADIKQSLKEEERKNRDLKYAGVKNVFSSISQGLKEAQANKRKTGVLFGKGLSKKKQTEDRFSNKGVFYSK